jgi:trk system potassium uptake protein TrkA
MNVLIVGAGKAGIYLADRLRHDHDVTVIERRPEVADHLAARIPGVIVVRGDGNEPSVLERAGASGADLAAALTGSDEDNLVIALLFKRRHEVPIVIARTNHPNNEWLFTEEWGVDVAVSAATVLDSLIEAKVGPAKVTDAADATESE